MTFISSLIDIYIQAIGNGEKTIDEVPSFIRDDVKNEMKQRNKAEQEKIKALQEAIAAEGKTETKAEAKKKAKA